MHAESKERSILEHGRNAMFRRATRGGSNSMTIPPIGNVPQVHSGSKYSNRMFRSGEDA